MNDGVILHYINGTLIEEPKGWGEFSDELVRDVKTRIIGTRYKASLTFTGGGFSTLQGIYETQGLCSFATYEALEWCGGAQYTVIRGEISLAECKFNETRCEVEADVADDGIGARIVNNKEIPISPTAEQTKNGWDITPVPAVDLEVFDPSASVGTYLPDTRKAFDWYTCLEHAVGYITDNELTLVSDWHTGLSTSEHYALTTGFELRTHAGNGAPLVYTFEELFDEIGKKYNLWIAVERNVNGTPYLRLEPEEYFYGASGTLQHLNIQDLVRSTDLDRMYAKVDVGSDTFIKEQGSTLSLPYLVLRGFTKESFHFEGVCNTDESLNLVNKWVIDSNVIEDTLMTPNDEYDDDIFIIQFNIATSQAVKGTYLNPGTAPYLYNEQLQNSLVIERYDLPSPVGAFFNPTTVSFRAARTANDATEVYTTTAGTSALAIVQFDNDYTAPNFDPSNAWGNGTAQGSPVSQANSRYTAAAQGYYEFDVNVIWEITQSVPIVFPTTPIPQRVYKTIRPIIVVERYDSGNTLISTNTITADPAYVPNVYSIGGTVGVSLEAGDYVIAQYQFEHFNFALLTPFAGPSPGPFFPSGVTVRLHSGSTILTSFVTGGGYVAGGGQARIVLYEYERHVDVATWLSLTGDPKQTIAIGGGPQVTQTTHLLNAERNIKTGETSWQVVKRP